MELLQIENLSFVYPNEEKPALCDVSFTVNSGEFIVICGESGCGKTTLLKLCKQALAPFGAKAGEIRYRGVLLDRMEERDAAQEIGYVLQNPDHQIVTDRVWHELAFGLENLGLPTPVIRRRVGEMASYFGIQDWFRSSTDALSGGQKQLLNLASVMVMQPNLLLLDEPTSQLDPIAAADFIATLQRMNRELGLTILLVEHRLEDVFPIADKVLLLEEGRVKQFDTPRKVGEALRNDHGNQTMLLGLPSAVRIYHELETGGPCPLTVKEGRNYLSEHFTNEIDTAPPTPHTHGDRIAVSMKDVWFRYERNLPDVLRGVNLEVYTGEILFLLGGNGTGKTTTLNVISGLDKAYRGRLQINGKPVSSYKGNTLYRHCLAMLPQNPQTVFLQSRVEDELNHALETMECPPQDRTKKVDAVAKKLGISHLLKRHPYDLSGGEQQKCALAKLLLLEPSILLLDEPTKGLDAGAKQTLREILQELKHEGLTIFIVTHDVEFAAECGDRCALFFDGEIISIDSPERFFAGNNFYTTAASRISRHLYHDAVRCSQVAALCRQNSRR